MKKALEEIDLVKILEAYEPVVRLFNKLDFGASSELVQEFYECCTSSGKYTVNLSSPLILGFYSFVEGLRFGLSRAEGFEND